MFQGDKEQASSHHMTVSLAVGIRGSRPELGLKAWDLDSEAPQTRAGRHLRGAQMPGRLQRVFWLHTCRWTSDGCISSGVRVAVGVRFFIVFSQDQKIESMKTNRKY